MIDYHYHVSGRYLKRDIETLKENIIKYNIEKVIVLASYFPDSGSGISNYRLLNAIKDIPEAYMLCSLDFEYYYHMGINEIQDIITEEKVLGLKIYAGYQNIDFTGDKINFLLEIVKNKLVMIHTGFCHKLGKPFNPTELVGLISTFDETIFILSHLGNPYYKELVYLMSEYKNVYTDMSGLIEKKSDTERAFECITYVLPLFQERILFGTDFPVQSFEDSFKLIKDFPGVLTNRINQFGI